MSIQDKIIIDQMAVASAQSVLDAANAQLAADQSALAAVEPILAKLDEIEAFVQVNAASLYDQFKALIEEARAFLIN